MEENVQHESSQSLSESFKNKLRTRTREKQKLERYKVLNRKRIRLGCDGEIETNVLREPEVRNIAQSIGRKDGDQRNLLLSLCKAFTQDESHIDTFLRTETALSSLVGILSNHSSDLQLVAAWCITNMATGSHDHTVKVLSSAGPYLITFLQSGSSELQDQCCWALANIAGDCDKCRQMLVDQGAIPQLVKLLHSSFPHVCQSAAFALSNFAQGGESLCRYLVEQGILTNPIFHLSRSYCYKHTDVVTEVAWMYFYLTARVSGGMSELVNLGEVITSLLVVLSKDPAVPELITPLMRSLGNLSCDQQRRQKMLRNESLPQTLKMLLATGHSHTRKEILWVISNFSVDVDFVEAMRQCGLVSELMSYILSPTDIQKELLHCLCNIVSHAQTPFKLWMIEQDVVSQLLPFLRSSDDEFVTLGLRLIAIVSHNPASDTINCHVACTSALESLQYHSSINIQSLACTLLTKIKTD